MKCHIFLSIIFLLSSQATINATIFDDIASWLSWNTGQSTNSASQIPLGEYNMRLSQARSYVAQYLASIDHGLRPHVYNNDMDWLKSQVYQALRESSFVYKWISNRKWYSRDKINQIVLSNLLDLIKNNSYSYALEQSNNQMVSQKIADSMRNNALAIIQKYASLDIQLLRPFFGDNLKRRIRKELNNFDVPYQHNYDISYNQESISYTEQPYAAHYYPSEACCVCLEQFDIVERIFLKPCGHDMCKICAIEWFYEYNADQTKTCPICRSWVNLDQLGIDLNI